MPFAPEALGDQEALVPADIAQQLAALEHLAPGDFANVCRQRDVLGETLTPQQFLRRLMQECRFKAKALHGAWRRHRRLRRGPAAGA